MDDDLLEFEDYITELYDFNLLDLLEEDYIVESAETDLAVFSTE